MVSGSGGSVLQSWEWGEFRRHQGWRPLRVTDGSGAAQVLLKKAPIPGFGSFGYVPYGPALSDAGALGGFLEGLSGVARGAGAFVLEVEPRVEEGYAGIGDGYGRSGSSVQPRCTFVLDILDDEEAQLAALPKDTRYGVRRAKKQGVVSGESGDVGRDLELFLDLLEETAERQEFAVRPREYYRRFMEMLPAHLIVARREGEDALLAGAITLTFGEESVYLYGASTREGENLYASYLNQFEAFTVARSRGVKRYDFGGIPCTPTEDHPLWGVYKFKKKFGVREERYIGTHEKVLNPLQAGVVKRGIKGYYALQKMRGRGSGPIDD